jgi:hypothetical protein
MALKSIYVDPGVHGSGVAYFAGGVLYEAEYRPSDRPLPYLDSPCVCEKPQVYPHSKRPSDLIDLAVAAGRMTSLLRTTYILPRQWSTVPKEVRHARMWQLLSEAELQVLEGVDCAKSLRHNVYDAVCIGLTIQERLGHGQTKKIKGSRDASDGHTRGDG